MYITRKFWDSLSCQTITEYRRGSVIIGYKEHSTGKLRLDPIHEMDIRADVPTFRSLSEKQVNRYRRKGYSVPSYGSRWYFIKAIDRQAPDFDELEPELEDLWEEDEPVDLW